MKSKPYKLNGKLFRYDFDTATVAQIFKATDDLIWEEKEWIESHGRPLYDIDRDGYIETASVGLRRENWRNKAARDEYLAEWIEELDEEARILTSNFIKYEMPFLEKQMAGESI